MEDKKINEQESLNLIANMIQQTNRQLGQGTGNIIIAWGTLFTAVSVAVNIAIYITSDIMCMWGLLAIMAIGFPMQWIMNRLNRKKQTAHVKTYQEETLHNIWKCTGTVMVLFPISLILFRDNDPFCPNWANILFLGMFLPALASYITGVVLKNQRIQNIACGALGGCLCFFAKDIEEADLTNRYYLYLFTFTACSILSIIVPGILINRQAKTENKK